MVIEVLDECDAVYSIVPIRPAHGKKDIDIDELSDTNGHRELSHPTDAGKEL
jgi:hypothetical protein